MIFTCIIFGSFEKLRKATVSFVISVCPSALDNSAPNVRIFTKFEYRVFLKNLTKTGSLLYMRRMKIYDGISLNFSCNETCFRRKS
jgi:hypothetical protein